ncbi:MAG: zinc ribbon domain-containing protein [Lachnospiraceae bacterium]|nr:zinc ribbon domain-containing protein [Lachnospiraceae bacterium]
MICPKCGAINKEDSVFCLKCGTKLLEETETLNHPPKRSRIPIIAAVVILLCAIGAVVYMMSKGGIKSGGTESEGKGNSFPLEMMEAQREKAEAEDEDAWKEIVGSYEDYLMSNESIYIYYSIQDLNMDGIPELLAAEELTDDESNDYPEDAYLVKMVDVFTYSKEVGMIEAGSISAQMVLEIGTSDGWLRSSWGGSGCSQSIFYTLNEENQVEQLYLTENLDTGEFTYGRPDEEKKISEEEASEIREVWADSEYLIVDLVVFDDYDDDNDYDDYDDYEEETTDYSLDYSICEDNDIFEWRYSPQGYYDFYYPADFYPYVDEGDDGDWVTFSSNGADKLEFYREEYTSNSAVDNLSMEMDFAVNSLNNVEVLLHEKEVQEDGLVHGALCGRGENGEYVYIAISADEESTYNMVITAQQTDNQEQQKYIDYYMECMYRLCGFTRSTSPLRSFQEFVADEEN